MILYGINDKYWSLLIRNVITYAGDPHLISTIPSKNKIIYDGLQFPATINKENILLAWKVSLQS